MNKTEVDYLKELVTHKTVTSDKGELNKCAQYCEDYFRAKNLHVVTEEYNGYPNIIATTKKTKKPHILLQSHMDVVPASDELFKMSESKKSLHGRGVFDMKFACASYMSTLDRLSKDLRKYDFGIMLSFDEEIGGAKGVQSLLNNGYSCDVCILPDSGKNWQLETSAKGAWFVEFIKKGKNAHASEPETGVNSAEILNSALFDIKIISSKYSTEDLTVTITKFNSGKAMNQVPDHAEAVLDIRYRNKKILKLITLEIDKVIDKYEIVRKTKMFGSCLNVSKDDPLVSQFVNVVEKVIKRKVTEGSSAGSTDARFFCEKKIPCVVIQPDGDGRHSDDEWIDKKSFLQLTDVLVNYLERNAI